MSAPPQPAGLRLRPPRHERRGADGLERGTTEDPSQQRKVRCVRQQAIALDGCRHHGLRLDLSPEHGADALGRGSHDDRPGRRQTELTAAPRPLRRVGQIHEVVPDLVHRPIDRGADLESGHHGLLWTREPIDRKVVAGDGDPGRTGSGGQQMVRLGSRRPRGGCKVPEVWDAVRLPPRQPPPRCERRRARDRAPGQARRGDAVHRRGAEAARGGPAAQRLKGVPRPSPAGRADRCVTNSCARAKMSRLPGTNPAQADRT